MKIFSAAALSFSLSILLSGCSSSNKAPYYMPESDFGNADAAAYAAEGFTFRKPQTDRSNPKPWQFYYKSCESTGEESFYSRTSYTCSGPYY